MWITLYFYCSWIQLIDWLITVILWWIQMGMSLLWGWPLAASCVHVRNHSRNRHCEGEQDTNLYLQAKRKDTQEGVRATSRKRVLPSTRFGVNLLYYVEAQWVVSGMRLNWIFKEGGAWGGAWVLSISLPSFGNLRSVLVSGLWWEWMFLPS